MTEAPTVSFFVTSFLAHFSRPIVSGIPDPNSKQKVDYTKKPPRLVVTLLLSQARDWAIDVLAQECGLRLVEIEAFSLETHNRYGYAQRRTNLDAEFSQRKKSSKSALTAWSFVFERCESMEKDRRDHASASPPVFQYKRHPSDFVVIEDRVISGLIHPDEENIERKEEESKLTPTLALESLSRMLSIEQLKELVSLHETLSLPEEAVETGEKVSVKVKEVKPGLELDISPALDKAERTQFHECVRRAFRDELEVRTLT